MTAGAARPRPAALPCRGLFSFSHRTHTATTGDDAARALAADPLLLVLDEPAAGLRRNEKQKLADLLANLRRDHVTILLVEHDMEFVMNLVDRIVVMDFGTKLCEGDPAAIRNDARVQEAYLGSTV